MIHVARTKEMRMSKGFGVLKEQCECVLNLDLEAGCPIVLNFTRNVPLLCPILS